MSHLKTETEYREAIRFLYSKLPMFQRVGPKAFKTNLDNIHELTEALDRPERKFKSIHIAGTNGKGSVAHITAAIFQSAGYNAGLYTSPHYLDFRERIKINGQPVSKEFVCEFVNRIRELTLRLKPSFFEISVAMAFDYFSRSDIDIAIIETGLGGRLDSTNIVLPEISVITNIGFDHTNFLGDTLPKIAAEKAGIIKWGKPVIIGKIQAETKPVFEKIAGEKNAPLIFAEDHLRTECQKKSLEESCIDVWINGEKWLEQKTTDLTGSWHAENINTALATVLELRKNDWKITDRQVEDGLSSVRGKTNFYGRMQILRKNPVVLADSAHNVDGMRMLMDELRHIDHRKLHIVTGLVNDKDPGGLLSLFPKSASFYFAKADIPRGMPAEELQIHANKFQLMGEVFSTVKDACLAAIDSAKREELVLVCGSIFTVAEAIETLQERAK